MEEQAINPDITVLDISIPFDKSLNIDMENLQEKVVNAMWWMDHTFTTDEHNFMITLISKVYKEYAKSQD